jgi:hypothetical protein
MKQRDTGQSADPLATLTTAEVMRHLQVKSRNGLKAMIGRGECPPPTLRVGGRPRWARQAFLTWLDQRAAAAQEARDVS